MITVNGEKKEFVSTTLEAFLIEEGYDLSKVVVERNLNIIPKDSLKNVLLEDEDTIEVLRFVGGG